VRWNGGVKKSDTESSQRDSGKNRFVHEARNRTIIRTILEHGEETSAPGTLRNRLAFLSFVGKIMTNGILPAISPRSVVQPWRVLSQAGIHD
jgi:hypothetical protein